MLNTMWRSAEHMNRNSGFPTFEVITLCVLTIFVSSPEVKNCPTYFQDTSHKC